MSTPFILYSHHRILPMPTPGMAPQDAFKAVPQAFDKAKMGHGFEHIFRTTGKVPASGSQQRGNHILIATYQYPDTPAYYREEYRHLFLLHKVGMNRTGCPDGVPNTSSSCITTRP